MLSRQSLIFKHPLWLIIRPLYAILSFFAVRFISIQKSASVRPYLPLLMASMAFSFAAIYLGDCHTGLSPSFVCSTVFSLNMLPSLYLQILLYNDFRALCRPAGFQKLLYRRFVRHGGLIGQKLVMPLRRPPYKDFLVYLDAF